MGGILNEIMYGFLLLVLIVGSILPLYFMLRGDR